MPQEGALVGQTLDGYRLRKLLGVGGMAEVYLAEEPSLRRDVAVKVLPRMLATDPNYVARFRDEARHVANLSHPNIVPVYTFGEDRGLLFLVMPLLKESLRDRMEREGQLAPKDAGRVAYAIASALHTAHHFGIVHRDVKPENILMDSDSKPMLTDFGIAREIAALREDGAARTLAATGLPVGTPEYMAPEQLRGQPATAQVDIYALGAVLYEMLTARVPHDASTPYEVATAVLRDPITPPSRLNPTVTPALERVVLAAMARDPASRYPDMRAFALDLRDALTGRSANTNSLRWTRFIPAARGGPSALPSRPMEPEDVASVIASAGRDTPPAGATAKRPTFAALAGAGAGGGVAALRGPLGASGPLDGGRGRPPVSVASSRRRGASALSRPLQRLLLSLWPAGRRPTPLALAALSAVLLVGLVGISLTTAAVSGLFSTGLGLFSPNKGASTSVYVVITATPGPTATPEPTITPRPTNTPHPTSPHTLAFTATSVTLTRPSRKSTLCTTSTPLIIQNLDSRSLTWTWDSSSFSKVSSAQWKLSSSSSYTYFFSKSPSATLKGYSGGSTIPSSSLWLRSACATGTYSVTFKDSVGRSYTLKIVING
ncbi:MAG TPA: protein kinase [Ktedonobacterales bacterium]|nr:protein kinase [Ktedonobacterales bacterium]